MSLLRDVSVPPPASPSCGPFIEQSPSIGELLELAIYYGRLITPPNIFWMPQLKDRGVDIPCTWGDQGYIGTARWSGKFEGLWRELIGAGRVYPVETGVVIEYEGEEEHHEGQWYSYNRRVRVSISQEREHQTEGRASKIYRLPFPRDSQRTTKVTQMAEAIIAKDVYWLDHILTPLIAAHPELQPLKQRSIRFIPETGQSNSFDDYRGTWTITANIDLRSIQVNLAFYYGSGSTLFHQLSLLEYLYLKLGLLYAEWGLAVLSQADVFVPQQGQLDTVKAIQRRQTTPSPASKTSEIYEFQTLAFGNARALAESIDAGSVKPSQVSKLIERFDGWRTLNNDVPPNESLTAAYINELATVPWVERLPTRAVRFSICTLVGVGLELAGAGGLGTLVATGLGAADTFILGAFGDRRPLVRFGKEVRRIIR